jgi:hypothetical protein
MGPITLTRIVFIDSPEVIMRAILLVLFLTSSVMAAPPIEIARPLDRQSPAQPRGAFLSDGNAVVIYGVGNAICLTRLADGRAFEPVIVGRMDKLALGMRRGPRVAVSGKSIVVTAMGQRPVNGQARATLVAWRSEDGGNIWREAVPVHDPEADTREGLHDLAAHPDGRFACVWLDLRHGKTELVGSVSTDGGQTWNADQVLYRSPSGSICECCHPTVTFAADGSIVALWRNSIDGDRDMYMVRFDGDLAPRGEANKLGEGTWPIDGCPMDGGDVVLNGQGTGIAVWRRGTDLYVTEGTGPEKRLGSGQQPIVAMSPSGPIVAWQTARRGDLMVAQPGSTAPVRIAGRASFADLVTGPDGRTLLVWEQQSSDGSVVMATEFTSPQ